MSVAPRGETTMRDHTSCDALGVYMKLRQKRTVVCNGAKAFMNALPFVVALAVILIPRGPGVNTNVEAFAPLPFGMIRPLGRIAPATQPFSNGQEKEYTHIVQVQQRLSYPNSQASTSACLALKRPTEKQTITTSSTSPTAASVSAENARFLALTALAKTTRKRLQQEKRQKGKGGGGGGGEVFAVRNLEADQRYLKGLTSRDRAFARLLLSTVERHTGQIDHVLSKVANTYPPRKGKHAARLQATLQIGVAQLLFLQTPPHAALKETVDTLRFRSRKDGSKDESEDGVP
jgi:transcription termination factor NusB